MDSPGQPLGQKQMQPLILPGEERSMDSLDESFHKSLAGLAVLWGGLGEFQSLPYHELDIRRLCQHFSCTTVSWWCWLSDVARTGCDQLFILHMRNFSLYFMQLVTPPKLLAKPKCRRQCSESPRKKKDKKEKKAWRADGFLTGFVIEINHLYRDINIMKQPRYEMNLDFGAISIESKWPTVFVVPEIVSQLSS